MKKAVMIVAPAGFRDEEYFDTKAVLEKFGIEVKTASWGSGIAKGKFGKQTKIDLSVQDIDITQFDAIVFIGGPGIYDYFNNKTAQKIAADTLISNKILASICASPGILANAGILKDKTVTCFPGVSNLLRSKGALCTGKGVEIDGNLITADGPESAKKFGEAIAKGIGT